MTNNNHTITPPPELVQQWSSESLATQHLCTRAARWGVDQAITELAQQIADTELEACCEWVEREIGLGREWGAELRSARRPKPPSLKEQALEALNEADQGLNESEWRPRSNTIRRALESLPD